MSIHYNHSLIGKNGRFNAYQLEKEGIVSGSTLNAIYHDRPIRTDALLRILEYADCSLEDFLLSEEYRNEGDRRHFRLSFPEMVNDGIISETVGRHYRKGLPMSLSTLDTIAEYYGVEIHDLIRIDTVTATDGSGHLKKRRKMVYLIEY